MMYEVTVEIQSEGNIESHSIDVEADDWGIALCKVEPYFNRWLQYEGLKVAHVSAKEINKMMPLKLCPYCGNVTVADDIPLGRCLRLKEEQDDD